MHSLFVSRSLSDRYFGFFSPEMLYVYATSRRGKKRKWYLLKSHASSSRATWVSHHFYYFVFTWLKFHEWSQRIVALLFSKFFFGSIFSVSTKFVSLLLFAPQSKKTVAPIAGAMYGHLLNICTMLSFLHSFWKQ